MFAWFAGLAQSVFTLGYPGVVLALFIEGTGLPFPGDAVMAFYGFAAAERRFAWHWVFVCCLAGYLVGSLASYLISRYFFTQIRERVAHLKISKFLGISPRNMTRATSMMDRYGPTLLIVGRFLPGIRSVSAYAAGLSGMRIAPFLVYTFIGTVMWCCTWITLGYWLEENVTVVIRSIQSSLGYITIAAVLCFGVWWFFFRRRRA